METDPSAAVRDMSSFKVIYDGDRHDIDAEVLLTSVGDVTELISEINEEIGDERKLEIRIAAPERGSFEIELGLISDGLGLVFGNSEVTAYTASVFEGLVALFDFWKFLNGEDPSGVEAEGDRNRVYNNSGDVMVVNGNVYNLSQEDNVQQLLRENFDVLDKDESVEGFRIQDNETGEDRLEVQRDQFPRLAGETEQEERETRTVTDQMQVTVVRVVFDPDRYWEFLHRGDKISAPIEDLGFWARVNNREEQFQQGDRLDIELERTQEYDPSLTDWVTKSLRVTRVKRLARGFVRRRRRVGLPQTQKKQAASPTETTRLFRTDRSEYHPQWYGRQSIEAPVSRQWEHSLKGPSLCYEGAISIGLDSAAAESEVEPQQVRR